MRNDHHPTTQQIIELSDTEEVKARLDKIEEEVIAPCETCEHNCVDCFADDPRPTICEHVQAWCNRDMQKCQRISAERHAGAQSMVRRMGRRSRGG